MAIKITGNVKNMNKNEMELFAELVDIFNSHATSNATKNRYYEGHIYLGDVNLGIALPEGVSGLEIGCEWGTKTVDVLAGRSMFDGFVSSSGDYSEQMQAISNDNRMIAEYIKAVKDELKFGCTFATLSKKPNGCKIRWHSPETASATWNGSEGRIGAGLAILDSRKDESDKAWSPSILGMYTDQYTYLIVRKNSTWTVTEKHPNAMGRPLMEPMIWNATSKKPFGRSRIKSTIRHLIEGYIRTVANATIGLEFSTTPQKYLLGITDEQYDTLINQKFKQYIGSIITATANPETGQNPTFGQLAQGSITPHVEMLRILATQFSAASGLTVTDTGVVNDANPTSSDAILAQSQSLVTLAEQLNTANNDSLVTIGRMSQAIAKDITLENLSPEENSIIAHFKNPAMPSLASTADAALKIASARPGFASTDVFLEMTGFSQADIKRIKAQETRSRGLQVLQDLGE